MASLPEFGPRIRAWLAPYAEQVHLERFSALQVMVATVVVAGLACLLLWLTDGHRLALLIFPLFVALRAAMAVIAEIVHEDHDPMEPEEISLAEIADLAAEAVLYMGLAVVSGLSVVIVGLTVAAGLIVETAGLLPAMGTGERRTDGPFGRSGRAAFWAAIALLIALGLGGAWLNVVLIAGIGLAGWTAWRRCQPKPEAAETPAAKPGEVRI